MTGQSSDSAAREPSDPESGLSFALSGGLDAGPAARAAVLAGNGLVPAAVRDDVLLLLTELVTNAVRHAGVGSAQSLRVELTRWPRRLRTEVADAGPGFEHTPGRPARDGDGGWGLVLVERIADRWGVTSATGYTSVWFEIGWDA